MLHTLAVSPSRAGQGIGTRFEQFYEQYALEHGCHYLRIDTNRKNTAARGLYKKLGYQERGIIPARLTGYGMFFWCVWKNGFRKGRKTVYGKENSRPFQPGADLRFGSVLPDGKAGEGRVSGSGRNRGLRIGRKAKIWNLTAPKRNFWISGKIILT